MSAKTMSRNALAMRRLRAERLAEGLTARGFDRMNVRHPDLAGLGPREYQRAYMAKQRLEDRAGWTEAPDPCGEHHERPN